MATREICSSFATPLEVAIFGFCLRDLNWVTCLPSSAVLTPECDAYRTVLYCSARLLNGEVLVRYEYSYCKDFF